MGKILILSLFFASVFAYADCGEEQCYDYCSSQYVSVNGDSCGSSFNGTKGCYEAIGICSSGGGGNTPPVCGGIDCYDGCSGTYIFFNGANTCSQDFVNGCYAAEASCE